MAAPLRASSVASQRPPMPHVSSQFQSVDFSSRKTYDARSSLSSQKGPLVATQIYIRSLPSPPRSPGFSDSRSRTSLLATPENTTTNFANAPHKLHLSSEGYSLHSNVDSVFELPAALTFESPNSSTDVSFVAELDDTSAAGYVPNSSGRYSRVSATPDSSTGFKSNISSRAIIQVVDETIAAIEAANRELSARAEAAEALVYRLREQNTQLQIELDESRSNLQPRSTTPQRAFGTQTERRQTSHTSVDEKGSPALLNSATSPTSPLTNFNQALDAEKPPKKKPSRGVLKVTSSQRKQADAPTQSPPPDLRSRRASAFRSRSADRAKSSQQADRQPPPPIPALDIRIANSTSSKKHGRSLSSGDTKRRTPLSPTEKPLPPLGPMSPSVVQGVVEIGLGIKEDASAGDSSHQSSRDGAVAGSGSTTWKTLRNRKSWSRFRRDKTCEVDKYAPKVEGGKEKERRKEIEAMGSVAAVAGEEIKREKEKEKRNFKVPSVPDLRTLMKWHSKKDVPVGDAK